MTTNRKMFNDFRDAIHSASEHLMDIQDNLQNVVRQSRRFATGKGG
jgi:hypothetical protein